MLALSWSVMRLFAALISALGVLGQIHDVVTRPQTLPETSPSLVIPEVFWGQIHDVMTRPQTLPETSPSLVIPELLPGSCDFETDVCGYTNDNSWSLKWVRSKGAYVRGIETDHTNGTGNFLYLATNVDNAWSGMKSGIESPKLNYNGDICILFYYMIPGQGTIDVLIIDPMSTEPDTVLMVFDQNTDVWTQANITTEIKENSTVKFQSQKAGFFEYVAIDDIQITPGNCSGKGDKPIVKLCVITPKISQYTRTPSPTTSEPPATNTTQSLPSADMLVDNDVSDYETNDQEIALSFTSSNTVITTIVAVCIGISIVTFIIIFFDLFWRARDIHKNKKKLEPMFELHL